MDNHGTDRPTGTCPMCGQPLHRPGNFRRAWSAYGGWRQRRIVAVESNSLSPWQPTTSSPGEPGRFFEAIREHPYRPQNLESDFLVPLLQAGATGAFVTVAAGWWAWTHTGFTIDAALGLGVATGFATWLIMIIKNRSLLRSIETIVNSDLDHDGAIGQPDPEPRPLSLEITHRSENDGFRRMFRFDLPAGISEADFRDFAAGVVNEHRGLAESAWIGSNRPFSRQSYTALMETLDSAGLVRWKDSGNRVAGRELTPAGGRALRSWLQTRAEGPLAALTRSHSHDYTRVSGDYEFIEGAG